MSASLVGSEMCIRDRRLVALWAHGARAGSLAEGGEAARYRGPYYEAPVSYTHLTLPTICSV
eukprot:3045258-Alexandrium_andersonii.AAC.1